jgi:hypothetical protein
MPPPDVKTIAKLQALADLLWQAERTRLAAATARTEDCAAAQRTLAAQRQAERGAVANDAVAMAAAATWERWAHRHADTLADAHASAAVHEAQTLSQAAQEFGRVRALETLQTRALREAHRQRRATQERNGQPEP